MAERPRTGDGPREQEASAVTDGPFPVRLLRHLAMPPASVAFPPSGDPAASFDSAGPFDSGAQLDSGAWNMALDEALLESAEPGQLCLRFYDWSPATLSLGYFQGIAEREAHEASRPCPVVRRASGGGAILHDQELTYSIVVPRGSRVELDHRWLYDLMHESLLRTLRSFSIDVSSCRSAVAACDTPPGDVRGAQSFLCFQRHCSGDLLLGDHKVVGSAQRRSQTAVLQHGSILLRCSPYAPELPGIEELAGVSLDPSELVDRWLDLLHCEAGWEIREGQVSEREREVAYRKVKEKFGSPDWTLRR